MLRILYKTRSRRLLLFNIFLVLFKVYSRCWCRQTYVLTHTWSTSYVRQKKWNVYIRACKLNMFAVSMDIIAMRFDTYLIATFQSGDLLNFSPMRTH